MKLNSLIKSALSVALGVGCFALPAVAQTGTSLPDVACSGTKDCRQKAIASLSGFGLPADDAKAMAYFRVSAEQGDPLSQVALGALYAFECDATDPQEAMAWSAKAADAGWAQGAAEWVRNASAPGATVDEASVKAMEKRLTELTQRKVMKDVLARFKTGKSSFHRKTSREIEALLGKPFAEGAGKGIVEAIVAEGKDGDALSLWATGVLRENGVMLGRNAQEAADAYEAAARGGDTQSMAALATMFLTGPKDDRNEMAGAYWLDKAEKAGEKSTALTHAFRLKGEGKRDESAKAFKAALDKAVADNDDEMLAKLSLIYIWGEGVCQGETEKVTEVRRFAQRGELPAQLMLAMIYSEGWGTSRDAEKAAFWYAKTAAVDTDAVLPAALFYAGEGDTDKAVSVLDGAWKRIAAEKDAALRSKEVEKLDAFAGQKQIVVPLMTCTPLEADAVKTGPAAEADKKACLARTRKRIAFLEQASEKNISGATLLLAACYENGWGVTADKAKADSLKAKAGGA